jgi:hypothetical protein
MEKGYGSRGMGNYTKDNGGMEDGMEEAISNFRMNILTKVNGDLMHAPPKANKYGQMDLLITALGRTTSRKVE